MAKKLLLFSTDSKWFFESIFKMQVNDMMVKSEYHCQRKAKRLLKQRCENERNKIRIRFRYNEINSVSITST